MNILNDLFVFVVVMMIISFATGLILGGPDKGRKIIAWELKQLTRLGRWILKQVFQAIAELFGYLAKQCGGSKPKKSP